MNSKSCNYSCQEVKCLIRHLHRIIYRIEKNNHGDQPIVDHIDLIAGDITGKIDPSNPDYIKDTNPTTKVLARFNRDNFTVTPDGWHKVTFKTTLSKNTYFRLRGTNIPPNTPEETDENGNPW